MEYRIISSVDIDKSIKSIEYYIKSIIGRLGKFHKLNIDKSSIFRYNDVMYCKVWMQVLIGDTICENICLCNIINYKVNKENWNLVSRLEFKDLRFESIADMCISEKVINEVYKCNKTNIVDSDNVVEYKIGVQYKYNDEDKVERICKRIRDIMIKNSNIDNVKLIW